MKILFVWPEIPVTLLNFKCTLRLISTESETPPIGLLTVAAMLPRDWEKKLIDMDIDPLEDKQLKWSDYVFISAMCIQRESAKYLIAKCKRLGIKTVAGGPLFTTEYEEFQDVDHLVLNEAEVTLPLFLEDLRKGSPKHIYRSDKRADMHTTPVPLWELIDIQRYGRVGIQYSRGCPFNCEYCDIAAQLGRKQRTKTTEQILAELEKLYVSGWRGSVFFIDDNFIGNKRKLKSEILPAIIDWMEKKGRPFYFATQLSIDLSDDEELIGLMLKAGFYFVVIGLETPHRESLIECAKFQNLNRDITASIKKLHRRGLAVVGTFMLGFDHDPLSIFDTLISLIQESGIVFAPISLLIAFRGTRLYERIKQEGRLRKSPIEGFMDCWTNISPKMGYQVLIDGFKKVVGTIYSPRNYYARIITFLKDYRPVRSERRRIRLKYLIGWIKSMILLGIVEKERFQYWKLIFWCLSRCPRLTPLVILWTIDGFHIRKFYKI